MKVVVIGGTGLIGSRLVDRLTAHGHEAVPASPRLGVNTLTGEGLAGALDGASVVVDVSNSPSFEHRAALGFFETSTRNLLAAEAAAQVGHHVLLSVVGTARLSTLGDPDTSTAGYFLAKLAQERMVAGSGIACSIVHATQFYEFIKSIADDATVDGVVGVPDVAFQPMAADDVAERLGHIAVNAPVNGLTEVGGPERFRFDEPVRRVLAALRDPRPVVVDAAAGYFNIPVTEDTLVPADGAPLGAIRLDDWIRDQVATPAAAVS
jgi:uncharacterized protein YbjT (DUF2867 family)